jgi:hypothetical protein
MQTKTGTLQDEEQFDIDDVSDSKDDYNPPHSDHGNDSDADSTAQRDTTQNSHNRVNDPDAIPSLKPGASDIHYFFDRSGEKAVCRICRQVFSSLN